MTVQRTAYEGVIVPILTPVNSGGDVDFGALVELVNWLADNGVDGLFVAGTTGRFSHFSPTQNSRICASVANAVGDRVMIYGGASDSGPHRISENTKMMKEAGAHVMVTTAPYYLPYETQEVEDILRKIADSSPLPVIYYNIPQHVGYGLRAQFLQEMADHPNVVGYKDSSGDLAHHFDVLQRVKGKPFSVLIGKELLLTEALKAGSAGLVISFANAYPKLFVDFMQAARLGDWNRIEVLQAEVTQIFKKFSVKWEARPASSTLLLHIQDILRSQGVNIRVI